METDNSGGEPKYSETGVTGGLGFRQLATMGALPRKELRFIR